MGHNGVVVKLAEAGLKATPRQPEILKALVSAFHVENDTKSCVPLFLTLTAHEVYSEHQERMEKDKDIKRVSLFLYAGFQSFSCTNFHCVTETSTCPRISDCTSITEV